MINHPNKLTINNFSIDSIKIELNMIINLIENHSSAEIVFGETDYKSTIKQPTYSPLEYFGYWKINNNDIIKSSYLKYEILNHLYLLKNNSIEELHINFSNNPDYNMDLIDDTIKIKLYSNTITELHCNHKLFKSCKKLTIIYLYNPFDEDIIFKIYEDICNTNITIYVQTSNDSIKNSELLKLNKIKFL
jgi:hypothetical protein